MKAEEVAALMRCDGALVVLDCRSAIAFSNGHIGGAVHVGLPQLLLQRLRKGTLSLTSLLPDTINGPTVSVLIVAGQREREKEKDAQIAPLLFERFRQSGVPAYLLKDGFEAFSLAYPHFCCTDDILSSPIPSTSSQHPLLLLSLDKLSLNETDEQTEEAEETIRINSSEERNVPESEEQLPVKILNGLYLGNAKNACDRETLNRYGIRYILNVTANLPNTFERDKTFKYLQIPVEDHWSQCLSAHFPQALAFIEEGRQMGSAVLVHCLAGISRSVTITVAYLMHTLNLSLDDAYDLVRAHKTNIAPNLNFMGELLNFERQLRNCRESPDSGQFSYEEIVASNVPLSNHSSTTLKLQLHPANLTNH